MIPVVKKEVCFLQNGYQLYEYALKGILKSKDRVVLSSLYIGASVKEDLLINALRRKSRDLRKVLVLVDKYRHDRKENSIKKYVEKEDSFIKPIEVKKGNQIHPISPRLAEIMGVYHSKFMISDSTILITGANMSLEYFTTRKDQYVYFDDHTSASILCGIADSMEKNDVNRRLSYVLEVTEKRSIYGLISLSSRFKEINWHSTDHHISKFYLKTPYFNPPSLPLSPHTFALTSSKETNGFSRSAGLSRLVPIIYSYIQKEWLRNCSNLSILHYLNCCFHSKGTHSQIDPTIHVLHLGSSNFNVRSCVRDDEIHLILFNPEMTLIEYFHNEFRLRTETFKPSRSFGSRIIRVFKKIV